MPKHTTKITANPTVLGKDGRLKELLAWRAHDTCPGCGSGTYTSAIHDEDTYSDDEQFIILDDTAQYVPYKDFHCEKCGQQFRVYLGAIAIHELEDGEPV